MVASSCLPTEIWTHIASFADVHFTGALAATSSAFRVLAVWWWAELHSRMYPAYDHSPYGGAVPSLRTRLRAIRIATAPPAGTVEIPKRRMADLHFALRVHGKVRGEQICIEGHDLSMEGADSDWGFTFRIAPLPCSPLLRLAQSSRRPVFEQLGYRHPDFSFLPLMASLSVFRADGAVAIVSSWAGIDDAMDLDLLAFKVSEAPKFPTRWNPENDWFANYHDCSHDLELDLDSDGNIQARYSFYVNMLH